MLFPIKNREDLEKLNELVSLQNQVKAVRLQHKLGKQNFLEDMKKVYEPVTDTIKNVSEKLSKFFTENSINNNKAIENLNEKVLESMNDKGLIDSSLIEVIKSDNKGQFRLSKDPNSTKPNDFLINEKVPVTIFSNMLTYRDIKRVFKLEGDLYKVITDYKFNVDNSNKQDRKINYEFGKEMNFKLKNKGRPTIRHSSMIKLLEQPPTKASGFTKLIILSSDPDELCDRLRLLLQEKHAGNNSDILNDEIVAIVDKLLEYKCISKKQHEQILIKYILLKNILNVLVYM